MFIGPELMNFIAACAAVDSDAHLHDLLAAITVRLGFQQFALNHHVDLSRPPTDAISLMNYDQAWVDHAFSRRYHIDDPVHVASAKTGTGFWWSELPRLVDMTARQRRIIDEARGFGLTDGFSIPIHIPGEYRGTCSFGGVGLRHDDQTKWKAQLVGQCAFETARRLAVRRAGRPPGGVPPLSARQLDCLPLVALGKTDWEIGQILGVKKSTAHSHVTNMLGRYQVISRTQLVVHALLDGQMTYNAACGRSFHPLPRG
jgi:LuxR family quorum-sensing system transcriptional regulator CciR